MLPMLSVPGHRYSCTGAVALEEWAELMLETVGKQFLCWLPGLSKSPHAGHDCTGLGKPQARLLGLGWAAQGAEPLPLLSVGNSWRCWALGGAGGCCGNSAAFATPPALSRHCSVPRRSRDGREEPFPQSIVCTPFCFEFTCVFFDLLSCCPCSSLPSCFFTVVAGLFLP